jgi:hypothetical protein
MTNSMAAAATMPGPSSEVVASLAPSLGPAWTSKPGGWDTTGTREVFQIASPLGNPDLPPKAFTALPRRSGCCAISASTAWPAPPVTST